MHSIVTIFERMLNDSRRYGLVVGAGDGLDVAGLSVGDGVGGVEGDVEGERVGPDVGEVVG